MNSIHLPDDSVFWHLNNKDIVPLRHSLETDVVIVGGGMAGLTAAQSFVEKGARVVLLEKNFCGAGASGKSSGFITPNSELSLSDLERFYGIAEAQKLWNFVVGGVEHIRTTITTYNFDCDYQPADSLVVAHSSRAFKKMILPEYAIRRQLGYASTLYETPESVRHVVNSQSYVGAIAYPDSFGIHAYRYCLALKRLLQQKGVQIYEDTPALSIQNHTVITPHAEVKAGHVVVAVDYCLPDFGSLTKEVYHAQTSLMISAPLTDAEIAHIFPHKRYMAWDTDLIYTYFRLTGENRLMVGGSNLRTSYASTAQFHNRPVINKLQQYIQTKFPQLHITFEYVWPGLIGISKDLMPIAGYDKTMPTVYYITAATGLPWAAALGNYAVTAILENKQPFESYFSPYRSFALGSLAQTLLGTKLTFALSNMMRTGSF